MVVLAPTGVAALNVGGMTVHSFFRFPPKIQDLKDIKVSGDRRLYEKVDVLVVDEVSMLRCDVLDAMDTFLRRQGRTVPLRWRAAPAGRRPVPASTRRPRAERRYWAPEVLKPLLFSAFSYRMSRSFR